MVETERNDMLGAIKKQIQKQLNNICYSKYAKEALRQKDRYNEFLKSHNDTVFTGDRTETEWSFAKTKNVTVFFGNGTLSRRAADVFEKAFQRDQELMLAYAHEDCVGGDGRRHSPWIKPGWSPDTLQTNFYFGNIFAVRNSALRDISGKEAWRTADLIAAEFWNKPGAIRVIEEILLERQVEKKEADTFIECYEMPELTKALKENEVSLKSMVSIVIPSKDNPGVLENCVKTVTEKTENVSYEIIVVDNGSSTDNKSKMEELSKKYHFAYIYEPLEFNFSKMCNLGAAESGGEFLLFLNDDMEILEKDWLFKMLEKAVQSHVGAVGAKLLYPNSELIQHAGVTNLKVGPAHKLLKEDDSLIHYHGRNKFVHDMLAVTAACLLVEKRKYEAVGGFFEGIAVAYNDVDFCFSLYEMGYYNVQRNDVTLYHHESLSRGDDNLSGEKWQRLLAEKELLYTRHPKLRGKDPFYSSYLAEHFSDYLCNYEYEYEKRDCYTKVRAFQKEEPISFENNCLIVNVEHAEKQKKLDLTEAFEAYWIEGWSYVLSTDGQSADNCRYKRKVLLLGENGGIYEAACLSRYRKDVVEILPEQKNVALSGFVCRIPKGRLPKGSYKIAMLAADSCSAQKLYRKTEAVLEVED